MIEFLNNIFLYNWKGDILRSSTGGANVIFTEIETLKIQTNEIPKPAKRNDFEEDIIENRLRTQERVLLFKFSI